MVNLDILNGNELDSYHRPLIVTLNLEIHSDPINNNSHGHKHLIFDINKSDLFLNELKNYLFPPSRLENIEHLYHNFTTVLSYSNNKFSIEISGKN